MTFSWTSRPAALASLPWSALWLACGLTVEEFQPQRDAESQEPSAGTGGSSIERPAVSPPNDLVTERDADGGAGTSVGDPSTEPSGNPMGAGDTGSSAEQSRPGGEDAGSSAGDADSPDDAHPTDLPNPALDAGVSLPTPPDAGGDEVASDASPSPAPSVCPTSLRGGRCIVLSLQQVEWDTARALCQNFGGDLVTIDDAQQDGDVQQLVAAQELTSGVWIGVREGDTELVFERPDGSPLVFDNFAEGQPNDENAPRCVEKRPDRDGEWFDRPCSLELPFVCEISLS